VPQYFLAVAEWFAQMDFLHNLKLRFSRIRIHDSDLGEMFFIFVSNAPERSYWEGQWTLPSTGTLVEVSLPGGETGPLLSAKEFIFGLPDRFEQIFAAARPKLEQVFQRSLRQELPVNMSTAVKLCGIGVENPEGRPIHWDIYFETTGPRLLGITIPFVDDVAQDAVVES
jgi:hypothetical protein